MFTSATVNRLDLEVRQTDPTFNSKLVFFFSEYTQAYTCSFVHNIHRQYRSNPIYQNYDIAEKLISQFSSHSGVPQLSNGYAQEFE